jgi:hypothetical protein
MEEQFLGADDQWVLTPDDHGLVMSKHRANRLGFASFWHFSVIAVGSTGRV